MAGAGVAAVRSEDRLQVQLLSCSTLTMNTSLPFHGRRNTTSYKLESWQQGFAAVGTQCFLRGHTSRQRKLSPRPRRRFIDDFFAIQLFASRRSICVCPANDCAPCGAVHRLRTSDLATKRTENLWDSEEKRPRHRRSRAGRDLPSAWGAGPNGSDAGIERRWRRSAQSSELCSLSSVSF